MAVNPFRTSIRRLATTARRAASSSYASTSQEMTNYHVQVSQAQGVADSLTGGKSLTLQLLPTKLCLNHV
jgi:hypothetical protein